MPKLSIRDLSLQGKRVFIRVDFNVPLSPEGEVQDDTRIRETLPTLRYALDHGARLVLASHLGRPKGKANLKYTLKPVAAHLRKLLGRDVAFSPDCTQSVPGDVVLLENVRFYAEEEANDPAFAAKLASLCDLYVNDAFGSAHRAHASTEGIAHCVSQAAAGLLMEKELNYLGAAITHPERPYVVILGGAKVSDKIEIIRNLLPLCDTMLIGGAMVYTFLKAKGVEIGKSLVENDKLDLARDLMSSPKLKLPVDHAIAPRIEQGAETRVQPIDDPVPADWMGLDIGPASVEQFAAEIASAKTILWNGPMGVFEVEQFSHGTVGVAKSVASAGATSIVGGGDSVAALAKAGVTAKITHVSTGGGASMEFLSGKKLPGVEALTEK
jgi:phosphoglycerate kinase